VFAYSASLALAALALATDRHAMLGRELLEFGIAIIEGPDGEGHTGDSRLWFSRFADAPWVRAGIVRGRDRHTPPLVRGRPWVRVGKRGPASRSQLTITRRVHVCPSLTLL
jgi:hypothetical protein